MNKDWMVGLHTNVVFVDPGLGGTGLAFFRKLDGPPDAVRQRAGGRGDWRERQFRLALWFAESLSIWQPNEVVIEYPEQFQSAKSHACVERGDLGKLYALCGMYMLVSYEQTTGVLPRLVSPNEWKGQLPKRVVDQRIRRTWGQTYPDHVSDAVGMGLAAQGLL